MNAKIIPALFLLALCASSLRLPSKESLRSLDEAFEQISSQTADPRRRPDQGSISALYEQFATIFDRPTSLYRQGVFSANVARMIAHNKQPSSWKMGLNQFADLTFEEFSFSFLMHEPQNCSATHYNYIFRSSDIPDNWDWRDHDAVTPVKNQGHCGSCWTFSTTGAVEAHWKIFRHKFVLLSEQQLVDCAQAFDNHGCNGGLPSHAFEYIRYAGGLQGEDTYPYEAVTSSCRFNATNVEAQVPLGAVNITALDEAAVAEAIALEGPVSVAFQVIDDFRFYKSGVYSSADCKNGPMDVNHAVLAVGYGIDQESGKKFFAIKNSWSETWGDKGYFKLERGVNMCGVGQCNSYPDVGKCAQTDVEI